MRDMEALGAEFARHALRQHAQARLGRRELGESGFAAQAARCAGEQHRAAPKRREPARGLASHQETAVAADPPKVLEHLRRHLAEIHLAIVARVIGHEVECIESGAGSHCAIEQMNNIVFARRVHNGGLRTVAFRGDGAHDLFDLAGATARDEHMMAAFGKAAAQRGTEAELGADADYDCDRLAHRVSRSSATKLAFIRLVRGYRGSKTFNMKDHFTTEDTEDTEEKQNGKNRIGVNGGMDYSQFLAANFRSDGLSTTETFQPEHFPRSCLASVSSVVNAYLLRSK